MRRGLRAKMRMRVVHSLHGTRGDARDTGVERHERNYRATTTHERASSAGQLSQGLTTGLHHGPCAQASRWRSRTLIRTRPRASSTCIRAIT